MFMSVDFPEPDAPMMATNSPSAIESETSRSARTQTSPIWYVLPTRSSSMSVGMVRLEHPSEGVLAAGRLRRVGRVAADIGDDEVAFVKVSFCDLRERTVGDAGVDRDPVRSTALHDPKHLLI